MMTLSNRYLLEENNDNFLGNGVYGKVYKIKDKTNEYKNLAVKIVIDQRVKPSEEENWKQIKGQYVVELIEVIKQNRNIYFIMPICDNGNLEEYINNNPRMNQHQIMDIFLKIIYGYKESMFDLKIIHRDLKPQNILIHEGNPKISDFGMTLKHNKEAQDQIIFSQVGTPKYSPPEIRGHFKVMNNQVVLENYNVVGNHKFDVYSLGCILYFCLYRQTPHNPQYQNELSDFYDNLNRYGSQAIPFPKRQFGNQSEEISENIKNLICNMIVYEKDKRFSIDEVLRHPSFQRTQFLRYKTLDIDILNKIQKLLNSQINDYINDNKITYEKIYYYSSIKSKNVIS